MKYIFHNFILKRCR